MQNSQQNPGKPHIFVLRRVWLMLLAVGPGIFCIGYTIGTGSVTTMTKSGSQYGMELLWVLLLSCLFSWVMMEAFGRYAVVTGQTAIHSFRTQMKFGPLLAVLAIVGVVTGQWTCLSGILGLSSSALYEVARLFLPGLASENYWAVLVIAIIMILTMYAFLLVGRYSFFEKVLVVFVTLMGVSFLISMFIVIPSPAEIVAGLVPHIPSDSDERLMLVAVVGTTLAAPTFVVRPLLMQGKGWNSSNTKEQSRDSAIAAVMMFVISASIMFCATGALFHDGKTITKVLD
ncbi:MAG: Nramp family divalent metal transporter, partial [Pirellulales bacterium]|nr:Nramp family divalent metal transporter [Pirellulales bacterium]